MRDDYKYKFIYTADVHSVKSAPGILHAIVVGETTSTALQIIDNTEGNTSNLGILKASIVEGTYIFNCKFSSGLRIKCGAGKYTIMYR
jgi:hypothetical protein